jgi:tRNA1Val (adenine37-N6)-methyltransferase
MSNLFFQFKQFTVQQEHCAMKVCTDACLLGAWAAGQFMQLHPQGKKILDIGTGTGLLSLMLAQNHPAEILGVEVEAAAAKQATENFAASPWHDRCSVLHQDIRTVDFTDQFECIISNPPFYANDLESPDTKKNMAHHSESLSFQELLAVVKNVMAPNGHFAILLPYHRQAVFEKLAKPFGLYVNLSVAIQQTPKHPFFRVMQLYGFKEVAYNEASICILYGEKYTTAFSELLAPYYLKL